MLRENFMSVGTTSACAENTVGASWRPRPSWNYLRVRGEYLRKIVNMHKQMELPPRARRILATTVSHRKNSGTTSACAENTGVLGSLGAVTGNYLRVRGEYSPKRSRTQLITELPPRARRIPDRVSLKRGEKGNYLRVRGEYKASESSSPIAQELPPRARRILSGRCLVPLWSGTTSACAENTCGHSIR